MSEWIGEMLGIVAAALGLIQLPDAAVLGLAIALVAVSVLTIAVSLSLLPLRTGDRPHPQRAISIGARLTQSDPDAAGHPRPRAPGVAVPA